MRSTDNPIPQPSNAFGNPFKPKPPERVDGVRSPEKFTIHIGSDLAPLEAAISELIALAELDPDAVLAFGQELERGGDIARQLFRIDGEQSTTVGAGDIRVVFEPSERLAEFLAAARARNVLE